MFSRIPQQLLTAEEQLGLYGELEFIKTLISEGVSIYDAVNAWRGADAEEKDFQFHNIGVEIKSSQKSDKLVKISNIRQLDTLGYNQLYLYYYSFAKSNSGDNTLPIQIESLRAILEGSPFIEEFELKLLNVGYYDADKENYTASYTLVNEEAYCVNSEFPKIVAGNVMTAIIDAAYVVDLNACDDFIVTYNSLIENIKKG
jgi:hypothetical protein